MLLQGWANTQWGDLTFGLLIQPSSLY